MEANVSEMMTIEESVDILEKMIQERRNSVDDLIALSTVIKVVRATLQRENHLILDAITQHRKWEFATSQQILDRLERLKFAFDLGARDTDEVFGIALELGRRLQSLEEIQKKTWRETVTFFVNQAESAGVTCPEFEMWKNREKD